MVKSRDGVVDCILKVVYAHNHLNERKQLWGNIIRLSMNIGIPWLVIGYFNNVLHCTNRIGGNPIQACEYADLEKMMDEARLSYFNNVLHCTNRIGGNPIQACEYVDLEKMMDEARLSQNQMDGNEYTWSNKHTSGMIYAKIDRALGNVEWIQNYHLVRVEVLDPHISDHSPLLVKFQQAPFVRRKSSFKFVNCLIEKEGVLDVITRNCRYKNSRDRPMYLLWNKLLRLHGDLKPFIRETGRIAQQIADTQQQLLSIQQARRMDRACPILCLREKENIEELVRLRDEEEKILQQKTKADWPIGIAAFGLA